MARLPFSAFAAGASLALSAGARAQGSANAVTSTGDALDLRANDGEVASARAETPLFGGTSCLPGTGLILFSGPPEPREADSPRKAPAGPDEDRGPEAEGGETGSDASIR